MASKKFYDKKANDFLYTYLNNYAPTGQEMAGQKIWLSYLKPYIDEWHLDNYGTAYAVINPDSDYRVVIEAHADEISWFVNHISKDGYIQVIRNGGSDHMIAPSKRVSIHTKNGPVRGVFGWPAIHTRRGKDADLKPTLDNIFIDVGASKKEEVEKLGIHVGCIVTYDGVLEELNDSYFSGRALDNRLGGFCIAQVARMLKENKEELPFGLYIVNAVQEEVGLKGATMIANALDPHVALVTDVCHDTSTPLVNAKKHGDTKCGKGPSLTYAPAVHNGLLDLIIETANSAKIPFQRAASSRATGTDTDAFAYSNNGVPSALISLPLKYMHTTVEMAHKDDVKNATMLIYETLKRIENGQDFRYFSEI